MLVEMKKQQIVPIAWTSEKDARKISFSNYERTNSFGRPPSYRSGVLGRNLILENI